MIFGTDVDAFIKKVASETKVQLKRNKGSMRRAQEVWRSEVAVRKLHNLIRAIRISAQRSEYFKNISREVSFPNDTRHGTAFEVNREVLEKLMAEK